MSFAGKHYHFENETLLAVLHHSYVEATMSVEGQDRSKSSHHTAEDSSQRQHVLGSSLLKGS
jgi:hypothetical protein